VPKGYGSCKKNSITKRNVPIEKKTEELYGKMEGTIHFKGDITKPIREKWSLCQHSDA
jgi:hypothetical protein